jgi:hypothetical protein
VNDNVVESAIPDDSVADADSEAAAECSEQTVGHGDVFAWNIFAQRRIMSPENQAVVL